MKALLKTIVILLLFKTVLFIVSKSRGNNKYKSVLLTGYHTHTTTINMSALQNEYWSRYPFISYYNIPYRISVKSSVNLYLRFESLLVHNCNVCVWRQNMETFSPDGLAWGAALILILYKIPFEPLDIQTVMCTFFRSNYRDE